MSRPRKASPKLLPPVLTYRYYVVWSSPTKIGAVEIHRPKPLNCWNEISETAKYIQQDNKIKDHVIITNWILL